MKYKILIKLTSLAISFALCLSAIPLGKLSVEAYGSDFPIVSKSYDYKSIKDLFDDIKDPDSFIPSLNEQHEKSNNLISKIVFSTGAAVIAAKLAWNLHKMYKENKNTSEKENKNKKHTDEKGFWTKIKDNLGMFKDKFLVYTALITLYINWSLRRINNTSYSLKMKKIKKTTKEYFPVLYTLFDNTPSFRRKYFLKFLKINSDIKIVKSLRTRIYKNLTITEEEKINFNKDVKEIENKIKKIFEEKKGWDPSKETILCCLDNGKICFFDQERRKTRCPI